MNRWTIAELKMQLARIECQLLRCQEARQTSNALASIGKAQTLRYNRLSAQKQDYMQLIKYAEDE